MPGTFSHRRRKIVAQLLRDRGLASDPTPYRLSFGKGRPVGAADWPVFVGAEPSEPDNVITVYDAAPIFHVKIQITGEEVYHWGVTIRVRGQTDDLTEQKAEDVAAALRPLTDHVVTLTDPSKQYLVQSFPRAPVVTVGKVQSPTGTALWVVNINAVAVILPYPIQG